MVELAPQTKIEEERPLLKVEGGSGDGSGRQPPPSTSPAWSVTCSSKSSWFDRWPEFLTACWMTGILLAISFLVMYVLTIGTMRKQPVVILKCNTSNPNNEVYYHHVVSRWNPETFQLYSDYLAHIAEEYPLLHFNVIFLIDRGLRYNKIYGRLTPMTKDILGSLEDHHYIQALRELQDKYQNLNITVIPLSKFMGRTPLRYKWRTIPPLYLPFYARISSVWQTGGIAIDLITSVDKFLNHVEDKKIATILKQHNDGIKLNEYKRTLDFIQRNEEYKYNSVIFKMFYELFNQIFPETNSVFDSSFWFPPILNDKELKTNESLVRTHRNKREATEQTMNRNNESINNNEDKKKLATVNTIAVTTQKDRKTSELNASTFTTTMKNMQNYFINSVSGELEKQENITKIQEKKENTTVSVVKEGIDESDYESNVMNDTNIINETNTINEQNMMNEPNMVMSYQISLRSDDPDLIYIRPQSLEYIDRLLKTEKQLNRPNIKHKKSLPSVPYFLTLESNGLFIASTSPMHPFLDQLMSADCRRLPPAYAIKNVFIHQCQAFHKVDIYCNNIYIF